MLLIDGDNGGNVNIEERKQAYDMHGEKTLHHIFKLVQHCLEGIGYYKPWIMQMFKPIVSYLTPRNTSKIGKTY